MKKLLVLALFAVMSLAVNAQSPNDEKYEYFIEVYFEWTGKNWTPRVAFDEEEQYIYDANGEKLKFKNRGAAINYFTKLGWSFVQYVKMGDNGASGNHVFFKKTLKSTEEAKKGFTFKEDLKK
jgi:hypothetical protein